MFQAVIVLLVFLLSACNGQQQGRAGGRLRGSTKQQPNQLAMPNSFQALTINYPLDLFVSDSKDWRLSRATFDPELVKESENGKPYVDIARAQDQEDVWLYENYFYGMKDGIIMESGALNGILFSTSFMFEHFANWTSIHVEADPENYDHLKVNREHAINVHGALCSEPRLLHYSSLGVLPVRGFIEFMSPSFMKKWHGKIYNNKTSVDSLPTVQCLPVKTLWRELSVKHIDLWILDVEGAEESVLKGTDFKAVDVSVVAMECDEHDNSKNNRKTSILEENNFKCKLIERNCMCVNNAYTPSSAPEKSMLRKWDGVKWSKPYVAEA